MPSPHQSSLLRALAENTDIDVSVIAAYPIPDWRSDLGWKAPDFGKVDVIVSPSDNELAELFRTYSNPADVHIFSGTRGYRLVWRALEHYITTAASIGFYSEASNWFGIPGKGRLIRGRIDALRLKKRVNFVLAIGHLAGKWYQMCGYPMPILYPFGYFVDLPTELNAKAQLPTHTDTSYRLVYVGQCVRRKGVDLLLHALAGLPDMSWELLIIGDGEEQSKLRKLSQDLGVREKVEFMGALPNELAMEQLAVADLLVLPSRWDGWGAVVNEALVRGVPVICSSQCGAADLLVGDMQGAVFIAGSVEQLRARLREQISAGKLTSWRKIEIMRWANGAISGEVAARYLLQIVEHAREPARIRPVAPWLKKAN